VKAVSLNTCVNGVPSPTPLASTYMPAAGSPDHSYEEFEFLCGCLNAMIEDSRMAGSSSGMGGRACERSGSGQIVAHRSNPFV
jgi:hypothetical protein